MKINHRRLLLAAGLAALLQCGVAVHAEEGEFPPFPKDILANPDQVREGKEVFGKICKFCHGKTAYPGKAPQLNPLRYTPEFVFDRVTNGFRGMPSFKEQFTESERQAVTAFIMSKGFSN